MDRFLDYFEEAVDRCSATGELVIMYNNFLIAYRSVPLFRQLINRQECATIQQHLSIISSQIRSPYTLPAGTLFPISLITFPNSAYFNLLL